MNPSLTDSFPGPEFANYRAAHVLINQAMFYLVKTPPLLRRMFPTCIWKMPATRHSLYLTFDDGPHPVATPFVLDQLKLYGAKATFFCIGKNVAEHMDIYRRIIEEGHRVGNHTHNHLNGWKSNNRDYLENISKAAGYIDSDLFRPPYGRISRFQVKLLRAKMQFRVVMWDVLSGDFDKKLTGSECAFHVTSHAEAGSIVVFHDSEKAFERMSVALPMVLEHFREREFQFEAIV